MADVPGNPPTNNAPASTWTTGLDPELLGHAQNLGWDKKSADEAAREAVKAHREARTYIGVPEAQLLRLPAKSQGEDPAAWGNVYQRLGAPKDAKEYDFSTVKFSDGTELEPAFVDAARELATKLHASKETATDIARVMVKYVEGQEAADNTTASAQLAAEKQALASSWGRNSDAFTVVAKRAAEVVGTAAGLTADQMAQVVTNLEAQVGYANTMRMFYGFATKIGEDRLLMTPPGGSRGEMSKEQAIARKRELMTDQAWQGRYFAGGEAENREFESLIRIERGG